MGDENEFVVPDVELEPVSSVDRNFEALGRGFRLLRQAVGNLASRPTVPTDALNALTARLASLETENTQLRERVAELERQAYDPPSPLRGQSPDGASSAETIAARVAALETRAAAVDLRVEEHHVTAQKSFGDVWSELHLLQQRLAKAEAKTSVDG
eukprot:CAMPEP_0174843492 /NCGR_PEP_ID=MMETSP1114-20130205/10562_1 /TAXON_ID=312471 /ORGANISM="Neobodo designis, Strain CCAP 1951/1" /LENGTH=155 /DNA_ID=CAMNT_0016077717 /DNA_START=52 /DNA_END=515 /DNA_ORIENTATION=+